jgi:hypothetical protein
VKAISASIIVLSGAILAFQRADFLVVVGMILMAIGFLAWIYLVSKTSGPAE